MNTITSIDRILEIKEHFQNERLKSNLQGNFKQEYYRGLSKEHYDLKSYLSRFAKDSTDLKNIEEDSLRAFEDGINAIGPNFLRKTSMNYAHFKDWEIMWQAQQAGLPTRLMDWSISIETACFFAVMNAENDDNDGQLFVFTCPSSICHPLNTDKYLDHNPSDFQDKFLINPDFNEKNNFEKQLAELRRLRQDGNFLFQNYTDSLIPLERQDPLKDDLHKFIIPKKEKEKLRQQLAEKGYNKSTILPEISPQVEELIDQIIKEKIERTIN